MADDEYPSVEERLAFVEEHRVHSPATVDDKAALRYAINAQIDGLIEVLEGIGLRVVGVTPEELLDAIGEVSVDLRIRMWEHLEQDRKHRGRRWPTIKDEPTD
jgi:hypothetical protein